MRTKSLEKLKGMQNLVDLEWMSNSPFLTIAFSDRWRIADVLVALSDEYDFLSSHAAFTYNRSGEVKLVELIFKEKAI